MTLNVLFRFNQPSLTTVAKKLEGKEYTISNNAPGLDRKVTTKVAVGQ